MGYGKGAAGQGGNAFFLMIIIFLELFGVTLGQLLAAVSPSIQVGDSLIVRDRGINVGVSC